MSYLSDYAACIFFLVFLFDFLYNPTVLVKMTFMSMQSFGTSLCHRSILYKGVTLSQTGCSGNSKDITRNEAIFTGILILDFGKLLNKKPS